MFPARYSPFVTFRGELDRLFHDIDTFSRATRQRALPALNVWEDEQAYFVEAECPGITMEGIEIYVAGNELTLNVRRSDSAFEGAKTHRKERVVGSFRRAITLPAEVDANAVRAELQAGVLTITLPKAQATQPRKIEVTKG